MYDTAEPVYCGWGPLPQNEGIGGEKTRHPSFLTGGVSPHPHWPLVLRGEEVLQPKGSQTTAVCWTS